MGVATKWRIIFRVMLKTKPGDKIMKISLQELFKSGAYFGHNKRFRNPEMAKYIYTERQGVNIIDLEQTKACFEEALAYVSKVVEARGVVVFVGTKATAQNLIAEEAKRCDMPFVDRRWLGGMLTNFKTIRASVKRLVGLSVDLESGKFEGLTKKERLCMMREHSKLEASLGGVKDMDKLPDAVFVVDVKHEKIAVQEANKLGIPVIGIVDTNSSPEGVDYIVPANDDALRSLRFFVSNVADVIAGIREKQKAEDERKKTVVSRVKKKSEADDKAAAPKEKKEATEAADEVKVKKVVKKKVVAKKTDEKIDVVETKAEKPVAKKVTKAEKEDEAKPAKKPAASKAKKSTEAKKEAKPAAKAVKKTTKAVKDTKGDK